MLAKGFPQRGLIFRLLVVHVRHFFARPEVRLRVAVAVQAPAHAQGLRLVDVGHRVDAAVTRLASDARVDVSRVVEVNEVGKVVDFDPLDRFVGFGDVAKKLELRAFASERDFGGWFVRRSVAAETDRGRRDGGETGFFHGGMAITAVHAEIAGVDFVAVVDRLDGLIADVSERRGADEVDDADQIERRADEHQSCREPKSIRPVGKEKRIHETPRVKG